MQTSERRVVVLTLPQPAPESAGKGGDSGAESAAAPASMRILNLRCPCTQSGASYMLVKAPAGAGAATIFEVQQTEESAVRPWSWFIDDHVQSDGRMNISTPIDPAFIHEESCDEELYEKCKRVQTGCQREQNDPQWSQMVPNSPKRS